MIPRKNKVIWLKFVIDRILPLGIETPDIGEYATILKQLTDLVKELQSAPDRWTRAEFLFRAQILKVDELTRNLPPSLVTNVRNALYSQAANDDNNLPRQRIILERDYPAQLFLKVLVRPETVYTSMAFGYALQILRGTLRLDEAQVRIHIRAMLSI